MDVKKAETGNIVMKKYLCDSESSIESVKESEKSTKSLEAWDSFYRVRKICKEDL